MIKERWAPIDEYDGAYEVSDQGRVRSLDRVSENGARRRGKILKQNKNGCGYPMVYLSSGGRIKCFLTHKLVAEAFLSGKGECVSHLDSDRTNNVYTNLEWTTHQLSTLRAYAEGRKMPRGKRRSCLLVDLGIKFDSVADAARWVSDSLDGAKKQSSIQSGITLALNGMNHTAYGYKWANWERF